MKRLFDLSCVGLAAPVLLPLAGLLAAAVKLKLGGPVLFVQERPGKDGVPFTMYKFRSMTEQRNENGELLSDKARLPPFGKWLRSSSLDELPELFNVVMGDMSLVGPRPLLMQYLPLYTKEQFRRHEVLPGITGWAQINGRNALSWEEKFSLDVWYVDHQTGILDLMILAKTVQKVLLRADVNAKGEATMPYFCGTDSTNKGSN